MTDNNRSYILIVRPTGRSFARVLQMTKKQIYAKIFECKNMIRAAKRQRLFAALPAIYAHKKRLEQALVRSAK